MTAQEELTALETAYSAWIGAGCPQAYSYNGRMVTKASADWMSKRIDQLRAVVARNTGSMFFASQFRNPE